MSAQSPATWHQAHLDERTRPFILLNLMFSIQAAYAGPVLMMSQNRQAERDRYQAQADFETNVKAECEIEDIQSRLQRIEGTLDRLASSLSEK